MIKDDHTEHLLDLTRTRGWVVIFVLGLCMAPFDHVFYGVTLLSDELAPVLHVSGEYVGLVPSAGQLLAIVGLLAATPFVSRKHFSGIMGGVVTIAASAAAIWPSGMPLAIALLCAAIFSVAQFAIWSRVLEAAPEGKDTKASALMFVGYAVGLWLLQVGTDLLAQSLDAGVRVGTLFSIFALLLAVTTAVLWWLCPAGHGFATYKPEIPTYLGKYKAALRDLRDGFKVAHNRRRLFIAFCSAGVLMLFDAQITGLAFALGLDRQAAAWSALAILLGSAPASVLAGRGANRKRGLILTGAILLIGTCVIGVGAALSVPMGLAWLTLGLFILARILLEAGTTFHSVLVPTLVVVKVELAAYVAAVQASRAAGKLAGTATSGGLFDLLGVDPGRPQVNVLAVVVLMALGGMLAWLTFRLSVREWRLRDRDTGSETIDPADVLLPTAEVAATPPGLWWPVEGDAPPRVLELDQHLAALATAAGVLSNDLRIGALPRGWVARFDASADDPSARRAVSAIAVGCPWLTHIWQGPVEPLPTGSDRLEADLRAERAGTGWAIVTADDPPRAPLVSVADVIRVAHVSGVDDLRLVRLDNGIGVELRIERRWCDAPHAHARALAGAFAIGVPGLSAVHVTWSTDAAPLVSASA